MVVVARGVRDDQVGADGAEQAENAEPGLGEIGDCGITDVEHVEPGAEDLGGPAGLFSPALGELEIGAAARAAAIAAADDRQVNMRARAEKLCERAGTAQLDVVGMGADRKHAPWEGGG